MVINTTPIHLDGVAAVISDKIISVEEYCEGIASPKKLHKLIATTGFESLSIADVDVCCSDMCFQAAEHLFNEGGFDRDSIDALIFVTQSPDHLVPATAYILQDRLHLKSDLLAFNIDLGCSGFVYGLYVAASMLSSADVRRVMLCCGDISNRIKKPKTTERGVIFGDAGACAIVSRDNAEVKTTFAIHSYGDRWQALYSERFGCRYESNIAAGKYESDENGQPPKRRSYMDGMGIMDFTLNEVVENINGLLAAANVDRNDIGAYLFHQPQKLLVDDLAKALNLNPESVIANAQHIGNTSSASIPLLLTEIGAAWSERSNKKVLMSGFGVGLSVASCIMDLDDLTVLKTKHYQR